MSDIYLTISYCGTRLENKHRRNGNPCSPSPEGGSEKGNPEKRSRLSDIKVTFERSVGRIPLFESPFGGRRSTAQCFLGFGASGFKVLGFSGLKRPKPVVSGWVVSRYLSFPLRKHCGNADKQQFKHVFLCERQNSDPNTTHPLTTHFGGSEGFRTMMLSRPNGTDHRRHQEGGGNRRCCRHTDWPYGQSSNVQSGKMWPAPGRCSLK